MIVRVLTAEDYTVATAGFSDEVLKSAPTRDVDLILLDFDSTDQKKGETAERFIARSDSPPVIVLADEPGHVHFKRASFCPIIGKPLDIGHLLQVIHDLIGQPTASLG